MQSRAWCEQRRRVAVHRERDRAARCKRNAWQNRETEAVAATAHLFLGALRVLPRINVKCR